MTGGPVVTCVVPTHRRGAELARAVRSVLAQTVGPAEVLVVDDTPESFAAAVVAPLAAPGGPAVRLVAAPAERGSAGRSRNVGAGEAAGDVVAFLDDDDEWSPEHLELALAALVDGVDLVVTWTARTDGERAVPDGRMPAGVTAQDAYGQNPGFFGSNVVVRAEALARVGGFDPELRVLNDLDLLVRLLEAGCRYAVVRQETVTRWVHGAQLSAGTGDRWGAGYVTKHQHKFSTRNRHDIRRMQLRAQLSQETARAHRLRTWTLLAVSTTPSEYARAVTSRLRRRALGYRGAAR